MGGVCPARQSFEPGYATGIRADLRLKPGSDLSGLKRGGRIVAQIGPFAPALLHFGRKGADCRRAGLLRLIQGGGGGLVPVCGRVPRCAVAQAKPDRAGDIDRQPAERCRLLDRGLHTARQRDAGFQIELAHRRQANSETAVAGACNDVAMAQRRQDPFTGSMQQLVRCLLSVARGELAKLVQFNHETARSQPGVHCLFIYNSGFAVEFVPQHQSGGAVARVGCDGGRGPGTQHQQRERQTQRHGQQRIFAPPPEGAQCQRGKERERRRAGQSRGDLLAEPFQAAGNRVPHGGAFQCLVHLHPADLRPGI